MKREILIIIGLAAVAVAIGLFIFLRGRDTSPTVSPNLASAEQSVAVVPFTKITQGEKSTVTRRVNYLITSTDELQKLWKMVDATIPPPAIDFEKQAVLAIFAGNESTSSIAIAKIEDTDTRLVSIAVTKPDSACVSKLAAPSPYEIVVVPATTLPLAHADLATTVSCPN